jgi:hypothetical protein
MKWVRERKQSKRIAESEPRISGNSFLFGKVVPTILIGFGILTSFLILVAVGIDLRIIPYP